MRYMSLEIMDSLVWVYLVLFVIEEKCSVVSEKCLGISTINVKCYYINTLLGGFFK